MEPLNIIEIKNFARHFQDYRDDYILIGGAAQQVTGSLRVVHPVRGTVVGCARPHRDRPAMRRGYVVGWRAWLPHGLKPVAR